MYFQTHIPSRALGEFVDSIVFLSGDTMGTGVAFPRIQQTIIINMGANFTSSDLYKKGSKEEEVKSLVWINGKHDAPFMLGNRGEMSMFAIGIKLGMLPFFAPLPASETSDTTLDALHWCPGEIFFLREKLFYCSNLQDAFALIEEFLIQLLKQRDLHQLPKISWLSKAIQNNSVNEICHTLGITRKRLRNEALHFLGSSVKNAQGILRLNQTLRSIAFNSDRSLSSLHEYYDQSHFINDFKSRTGITPLQYRRLCQQFPAIKYTPNFLPLRKETFLQFLDK
jgi:AraC-like DNA-binding protein